LESAPAAASPRAIAEDRLTIAHRAARAASAVRNAAMLQCVAASAAQKEVPKAQREAAAHRGQISSAALVPLLQVEQKGQSAPHVRVARRAPPVRVVRLVPIVPTASPVQIVQIAQPVPNAVAASAKAVRRVPETAASGPKSRFQASPLAPAHRGPAKARSARASVQQRAPDRNLAHHDSARVAPRVRRATASARNVVLVAVAKCEVPLGPTAPSASRKAIVPQAARAVLTDVQVPGRAQVVSAVRRAAMVSRAHPSEEGSRDRKATAPSSGHTRLQGIVRPDANQPAATESPAAATVPSVSSRPGPDLRAGPRAVLLRRVPKVASGNPVPSALQARAPAVPVDLASPPAVPADSTSRLAASASPALEDPAPANPALANRVAIANPPATGPPPSVIVQPPAGIIPTARVPRAPPSLPESVLLVQQAGTQLQVRANPAASVSPAVPASPSANHAPQEQGRVAPPPPQAPASRAVPADSAGRVQAANRAHPVVRPPKEASVTSSPAASLPVANVQPRNVPAVRERPNANPAAKETKAR
jgi:hypothetical protein